MRTTLAEGRDRGQHQGGICLMQTLPGQAQSGQPTWRQGFDQQIHATHEFEQRLSADVRLRIQLSAELARIQVAIEVTAGGFSRWIGTGMTPSIATRGLETQHLGTQIREQAPTVGTFGSRKLEHPQSLQCSCPHGVHGGITLLRSAACAARRM